MIGCHIRWLMSKTVITFRLLYMGPLLLWEVLCISIEQQTRCFDVICLKIDAMMKLTLVPNWSCFARRSSWKSTQFYASFWNAVFNKCWNLNWINLFFISSNGITQYFIQAFCHDHALFSKLLSVVKIWEKFSIPHKIDSKKIEIKYMK